MSISEKNRKDLQKKGISINPEKGAAEKNIENNNQKKKPLWNLIYIDKEGKGDD